jgi:polysaccharide export outer membrane protein
MKTRLITGALAIALSTILGGCDTTTTGPTASDQRADIVLREGDVISVSFPGTPTLTAATQTIRRDGKVTLPIIGEVTAADMTPTQLQNQLISLYDKDLVSKEVVVTVVTSSFTVYVDGSVNHPGKIVSDHPMTALEAVMEAGGFNYTMADMRKVEVIRHKAGTKDYTYYTLNLKLILDGQESDLFYLAPGDVVHVPEKFSWF